MHLTLEEKIGQLLVVHVHAQEINEDCKTIVQELQVGGIIYYTWANGLNAPRQVRALSQGLQALSRIPLFICTDQEGGRVSRLSYLSFPSNQEAVDQPGLIAEWIGKSLLDVGINMNLAPVVDVGFGVDRSYSTDPQKVAECGLHALRAYQKEGVIATLKHCPGHGGASEDSHYVLPVIENIKVGLIPFQTLAPCAEVIMTAHVIAKPWDAEKCVTLSVKAIQQLRKQLPFQKVLITDSLVMQGVLQQAGSVERAAIDALKAGHDLLLLGGKLLLYGQKDLGVEEIKQVQAALVQAVRDGEISEGRVNQAVERVLHLKQSYLSRPGTVLEYATRR